MPITVKCAHCGQSFALRDDLAGRSVRCKCGQPLTVPNPSQGVLDGLLDAELSRPLERPTERKAPVHRPEPPKSSAPLPPTHSALAPGVNGAAAAAASPWRARLRETLRCSAGVIGLCYGMLMLWLGGVVGWRFLLKGLNLGVAQIPWFEIVLFGQTLTGFLLAVASVGVLLSRQEAGKKMSFAAWTMTILWVFFAGLMSIAALRYKFDEANPSFPLSFWMELGRIMSGHLTWAIAPALVYAWYALLGHRDLKS